MQDNNAGIVDASDENTGLVDMITDGLLAFDGIPLPGNVKKSFWKSVCMLITGLADVPAAKLEAVARSIRVEGQAKDAVTIAGARAAAVQFSESPELGDRAVNYFASRIVKEQINRENVVKIAAIELQGSPPSNDSTNEIDEDWLSMFSEIAKNKSNVDMQVYLAKILAGEVRKPGSFSPATLSALATISQPVALVFQQVCNLSMKLFDDVFILTSPYPNFRTNGIPELGITYKNLIMLQDQGLLAADLNSIYPFKQIVDRVAFDYCGQTVILESTGEVPEQMGKVQISLFSQAGVELREIISKQQIPEFTNKCQEWFGQQNVRIALLPKP